MIPPRIRWGVRCAITVGWIVVLALAADGDMATADLAAIITGVSAMVWMMWQWRRDVGSAFAAGYKCALMDYAAREDPFIPVPRPPSHNGHTTPTTRTLR